LFLNHTVPSICFEIKAVQPIRSDSRNRKLKPYGWTCFSKFNEIDETFAPDS